ncbi:ammonium transporter, partial [Bowmanella yangjiangensis]
LGGAVVMAALGFIPGYLLSYALKKADLLRVPAHAEERGLDLTEVPAQAYPEWTSMYGPSTSVGGSEPAPLATAEPKSA